MCGIPVNLLTVAYCTVYTFSVFVSHICSVSKKINLLGDFVIFLWPVFSELLVLEFEDLAEFADWQNICRNFQKLAKRLAMFDTNLQNLY